MKKYIVFVLAALLLAGCGGDQGEKPAYTQISQEEAKEMMARDDGHVVVDVRRQDEYDSGHIPGAVLIPNESIGGERPSELPDTEQVILVYCRSGNRSKQASQKLADLGYVNVYEFGGIMTWTGDIVTSADENDEESAGTPEQTEARTPDQTAGTSADDEEESETVPEGENAGMTLYIGTEAVPVTWEENESVDALRELLPLTIDMSMYGGFEQVGRIGTSIVSSDRKTTTSYGDIVLYSGDQIVIFYGSNLWSYTRLGHVDLTQEEMTALLGESDVTIKLAAD